MKIQWQVSLSAAKTYQDRSSGLIKRIDQPDHFNKYVLPFEMTLFKNDKGSSKVVAESLATVRTEQGAACMVVVFAFVPFGMARSWAPSNYWNLLDSPTKHKQAR